MEETITKEFLENVLKRKINYYSMSSGSNAGDNYSSTMHSIEVHFSSINESSLDQNFDSAEKYSLDIAKKSVVHLISKCYPQNASRQEMLINMNFCYKELSFYTIFVPELVKFQRDVLQLNEIINPAFPQVVTGQAINFDEEKAEPGKLYKPFDNFIMMVDLRKSFEFRLFNSLKSFDRPHVSLIVNAMAKNHALSWAYKQTHNICNIQSKFPFVKNDFSIKYFQDMITDMMPKSGMISYELIKATLGESSPVVRGAKKFLDASTEMLTMSYGVGHNHREYEKVMRIKPVKSAAKDIFEIPWKVVIQGDCWTNNMLFRYNEITGEPEDVILVDLQLIREACPTTDLAQMVYTSTDSEFRKSHLNDMLELYAEKFVHYCQMLKTEPLPGFSCENFKHRFHLSKAFGLCFALFGLPIFMLRENDIVEEDVDSIEEGTSVVDQMAFLCSGHLGQKNTALKERLVGVVQDMFDDGII